MKVVILAGGYGTRFGRLTDFLPKPMIPVGPQPILWHIMKIYSHFGYNEFIICLGYKSQLIKEYFLNFDAYDNDFTMSFSPERGSSLKVHGGRHQRPDWKVTLADTGLNTMTGGRLKRIARYLDEDEEFMMTYGDGVADIDIAKLVDFHRSHGKLATLTAAYPPPKFGDLKIDCNEVKEFAEKKRTNNGGHINGGFYVLNRAVLDYIDDETMSVLEKQPLERLSAEGQLMAYRHDGFWQCMDTTRDMDLLNELWTEKRAPWKIWQDAYAD